MAEENELWLKHKCNTEAGPYLLPFEPNYHWRNATVFIVGLNPIESFRQEFNSFEHYWQGLTQYPDQFEQVRQAKYPRRGEDRSRTKKRISELVRRLAPHNVLVTNVFAYPTVDPRRIPSTLKHEPLNEKIITRLILTCKPRALLFHGREARLFANKCFGVQLNAYTNPADQDISIIIPGAVKPSALFAYHHFVGRVEPHLVMKQHLEQLVQKIHLYVSQFSG